MTREKREFEAGSTNPKRFKGKEQASGGAYL